MTETTMNAGDRSFETRAGLTLAVLAAILAVNELGAGKYGDDEILGSNERSQAYAWYQSKSIKESLVEGQLQLLESLVQAGSVTAGARQGIDSQIGKLKEDVKRYKKEKKEIL